MIKVTCAIIIHRNKILVTQRLPNSDHPLKWEFPGGKLQSGESLNDCVLREIKEELEIEIDILKPLISVQFDYGFKQIELIPFLCVIKSGKIKLNQHLDLMWVTYKNLNQVDFAEADRKLIQIDQNKDFLKKHLGKNMYNS
jgi:8-oxo-dGTP diphosphatase